MEKNKENLIKSLKIHIDFVRTKIKDKLEMIKIIANRSLKELARLAPEDQMVYMNLRASAQTRVVELNHLDSSPYFVKCDVLNEKNERKTYFFSKHEFYEQSIYSWVAPVAAIRFEKPGKVSYKMPDGTIRNITVEKKEQYMIVDGKIVFFAIEDGDKARELIYQEHFTMQKSKFALPEIVAQMEKAQDQVIRANYKGSLVISGPAGSGKTTLALHRVAYLTQAPDTSGFYPPRSIVVFVQDNGTKEYFSTLLPGLGINDVQIATFSQWAQIALGLEEYSYIERYGENDEEKDLFEYQKIRALREGGISSWNSNIYITLNKQYQPYFSKNNLKLFDKQKNEKILDRFDLVILLKSYFAKYKKFETKREYQTFIKDKLVQRTEKTLVTYSLMIIDEFQNYLPEQLQLFRNCLDINTGSVVYVGDIAQQVKLGTVKNWNDLGETISSERNIRLNKVYRNTRHILEFIRNLGYAVEIPEGAKNGPIVIEKIINNIQDEINHIKKHISKYENGSIGILSKDETYLELFKKEFENTKNIHILTMLESQGVEFDIVFIVGINSKSFEITLHLDILPEHIEERRRMQKDLLYVALTRSITELHILGKDTLKNILDKDQI